MRRCIRCYIDTKTSLPLPSNPISSNATVSHSPRGNARRSPLGSFSGKSKHGEGCGDLANTTRSTESGGKYDGRSNGSVWPSFWRSVFQLLFFVISLCLHWHSTVFINCKAIKSANCQLWGYKSEIRLQNVHTLRILYKLCKTSLFPLLLVHSVLSWSTVQHHKMYRTLSSYQSWHSHDYWNLSLQLFHQN